MELLLLFIGFIVVVLLFLVVDYLHSWWAWRSAAREAALLAQLRENAERRAKILAEMRQHSPHVIRKPVGPSP